MSFIQRVREWATKGYVDITMLPLDRFDTRELSDSPQWCVLVGNASDLAMLTLMFNVEASGNTIIVAPADIRWPQLLVRLGCYASVPEALKEWNMRRKESIQIDHGARLHQITSRLALQVWKPVKQGESHELEAF